jgi:hypothetical protein
VSLQENTMSAMPTYQSTIAQILGTQAPRSSMSYLKGAFGNDPAVGAFGTAMDTANAANFTRGQQSLSLLAGQGNSTKAANQKLYGENLATIDQDLMSRGLGNSTILADQKAAQADALSRANASVDDTVAGNVANTLMSFQDKGPDLGMLSSLLMNRGATRTNNVVGMSGGGGGAVQQVMMPMPQGSIRSRLGM